MKRPRNRHWGTAWPSNGQESNIAYGPQAQDSYQKGGIIQVKSADYPGRHNSAQQLI
jgi:hypothetical protein